MKRYLIALCASASLLLPPPGAARAQTVDPIDPPDTEYRSGLDDIAPNIVATLPVKPTYRAFIPVAVDVSFKLPAPGNQGKAGSCTAWAVAYAARAYYTSTLENRNIHQRANIVSPNYVYALAKQVGKPPGTATECKGGSSIYGAVEVLKKGALSMNAYPYHDSDCDPPPRPEQVSVATDFRVRGFHLLDIAKIDDIKGALAQSQPVIIEFRDTPAWHQLRGSAVFTDLTVDPAKNDWHAMTLVGFDERKRAFRVINSWGQGWGDGGYAWMGYDVFSARVRRAAVLDVDPPAPPRPVEKVVVAELPKPIEKPKPVVEQPKPVAEPPKPVVQPPKPIVEPPKPVPVVEPPKPVIEQPKPVVVLPKPIPLPLPTPEPTPAERIAALANLTCGKITVRKDGERTALAGYVGSQADFDTVKRIGVEVPNVTLADVTLAPWPQCEAIQTLERPLAQIDQPRIGIGSQNLLRAGDPLHIQIRSPGQISYLYVSYIQADGSVVHLVQPEGLVAQPTLPNKTLTFGDGKDGSASFTVSAPFGREMIIAIASRSPLFDKPLPAQQTEREYLTAVRQALVYKPSPNMPDRELSASIKTLQTEARLP